MLETSTQLQIFDRTGRRLGFYMKQTDATHTIHSLLGRGNQLVRLMR